MMFDPTIYENLKVVLEGTVYDHDLQGKIIVTDRNDIMDMAKLSRCYRIRFRMRTAAERAAMTPSDAATAESFEELTPSILSTVQAEIFLLAEVEDLAGEILAVELNDTRGPGCILKVRWIVQAEDNEACLTIQEVLQEVWGTESAIVHRLSYVYDQPKAIEICSELDFQRKIDENQIEDLSSLVEHVFRSLRKLTDKFEGA
jgi:hypothetical protein